MYVCAAKIRVSKLASFKLMDHPKKSMKNITAYKFVALPEAGLPDQRAELKRVCMAHELKGTILLSPEGINLCLSGAEERIAGFWAHLTGCAAFSDMSYKRSFSEKHSFKRMLVKLKREIITLGVQEIKPAELSRPKIQPAELKQWLDEGRAVTLLDTRNDYEVNIGTFAHARRLDIASFRAFPAAVERLEPDLKARPLVMFCTGGIRCEKASPLLLKKGFNEVYQLDGGILRYLEEMGSAHFDGECFVFDDRVALDGKLQPTGAVLCENCQMPVTTEQQKCSDYKPGISCPYCVTKKTRPPKKNPSCKPSEHG